MILLKKLKKIYRLTGKLNLYISRCENLDKIRVERELSDIKKHIDEFEKEFKDYICENEKNIPEETTFVFLQE